MYKPFLDKLHDFALSIDYDFDSVNYGGCCAVAYAFAKHLQKYFPVKIIVANYAWMEKNDQDVSEIRQKLSTNTLAAWNENGISFAHILVEFEVDGITYHLETEDGLKERHTHTLGKHPILKGHLSLTDAEELANNPDGWNDRFDRDQLPAINKAINKFFQRNKPEMFQPLLSQ